jgi:ComF family protein
VNLLDFLFPKKCVGCGKFGDYICFSCFTKLSTSVAPRCLICGKNSFDGMTHPICIGKYTIDGYFASLNYKGIVKKLLYQFKYQPYLTDLHTTLTDLLHDALIQDELFANILAKQPLLIPIPLSKSKLRKRGYNQSEMLAKNLGKRLDLPVQNLLIRIKETKPQYGLKREDRIMNMEDAFSIAYGISHIAYGKNRNVFLVDDVLTTGSTLLEAAKILKKNGFGKVYGVVLAQD